MFYGPIFTEGVDQFLFDQVLDPILPGRGLPIPLPVRVGLYAVQVQVEAGQTIAAGEVAGKFQYTGQAAQAERAKSLGMNPESRTARFAQWLMDRDAKREEKESNLEGLMKFNIFLSTLTLVSVAGATALDYAMIAWLWV
jgi:hypothetical protein